MSKDKKGGNQNPQGKNPTGFDHSESGPFTPFTKGKEPSQSGPTSVSESHSDPQGGSASNKQSKTNLPAGAPSSPGGKGVGNNAGKGPTPS